MYLSLVYLSRIFNTINEFLSIKVYRLEEPDLL